MPTRIRDLDSEEWLKLSWLKGWYFFLRITVRSFFALGSFFFSWMNHLFHMGYEEKPFLPKFVLFFSKPQLTLITMVTCISAPCQGAWVNANQLRMGKWFLFLLAYRNLSADFFFLNLIFPLMFLFILMNSWVLYWTVLIANAPETAWPIKQRSWPTHFPLTIRLIYNTLIIQIPLCRQQHRQQRVTVYLWSSSAAWIQRA